MTLFGTPRTADTVLYEVQWTAVSSAVSMIRSGTSYFVLHSALQRYLVLVRARAGVSSPTSGQAARHRDTAAVEYRGVLRTVPYRQWAGSRMIHEPGQATVVNRSKRIVLAQFPS